MGCGGVERNPDVTVDNTVADPGQVSDFDSRESLEAITKILLYLVQITEIAYATDTSDVDRTFINEIENDHRGT